VIKRLRRRPRGQALVEFALIVPIFILLLVGILDLGRAIYAYNTVANASREGVRVGIVNQNVGAITDHAVDHAVALGLDASSIDVDFLEADYTDAAPCNVTPRYGCVVHVAVEYQYTPATPILGDIVGSITITGESQQQIERTNNAP